VEQLSNENEEINANDNASDLGIEQAGTTEIKEAEAIMQESVVPRRKTTLERYSENNFTDPVLLSDFDHKRDLITAKLKSDFSNPQAFLEKEISTSYIDPEMANIVNMLISCAENWSYLGFTLLSKRRYTSCLIDLGLQKSINGFERILQATQPSANVTLGKQESIAPTNADEIEKKEEKKNIIMRLVRRR
jgi:hypothetical protein